MESGIARALQVLDFRKYDYNSHNFDKKIILQKVLNEYFLIHHGKYMPWNKRFARGMGWCLTGAGIVLIILSIIKLNDPNAINSAALAIPLTLSVGFLFLGIWSFIIGYYSGPKANEEGY